MNKTASFHPALSLVFGQKYTLHAYSELHVCLFFCQNSILHAYLGLHADSEH